MSTLTASVVAMVKEWVASTVTVSPHPAPGPGRRSGWGWCSAGCCGGLSGGGASDAGQRTSGRSRASRRLTGSGGVGPPWPSTPDLPKRSTNQLLRSWSLNLWKTNKPTVWRKEDGRRFTSRWTFRKDGGQTDRQRECYHRHLCCLHSQTDSNFKNANNYFPDVYVWMCICI